MSTFDNREKAFEEKFARDADFQFRVNARRNKLLGLWAAERLGKFGAEAEAYAKSVVLADFQEAGEDDVLRKVSGDLEGAGVSEDEVRAQMTVLMQRAAKEIMEGR